MRKGVSNPVTPELAAIAKFLLNQGYAQHQVAAELGVNQGRISEIKHGIWHSAVAPATAYECKYLH